MGGVRAIIFTLNCLFLRLTKQLIDRLKNIINNIPKKEAKQQNPHISEAWNKWQYTLTCPKNPTVQNCRRNDRNQEPYKHKTILCITNADITILHSLPWKPVDLWFWTLVELYRIPCLKQSLQIVEYCELPQLSSIKL